MIETFEDEAAEEAHTTLFEKLVHVDTHISRMTELAEMTGMEYYGHYNPEIKDRFAPLEEATGIKTEFYPALGGYRER